MPVAKKERNEYTCAKCKHVWFKINVSDILPRMCPKCKTPNWNSEEYKEPYRKPNPTVTPPKRGDQKDGGQSQKDEAEPSSYSSKTIDDETEGQSPAPPSNSKQEVNMKKEIEIIEASPDTNTAEEYESLPYECPECKARFDALDNGKCPNPDCSVELEGVQ